MISLTSSTSGCMAHVVTCQVRDHRTDVTHFAFTSKLLGGRPVTDNLCVRGAPARSFLPEHAAVVSVPIRQTPERLNMLFSAMFPLAGRSKRRTASAASAANPSAESLRVTASALRAWGAETDADELEVRAARVAAS